DRTAHAVVAAFAELEERFSLYREDSEASRIGRDRSRIRTASEPYRDMYWDAVAWLAVTGGAFTPHRPDGVVDLSGIVKARAIEAAGDVLVADGHLDWCLNAGGDVLVSGLQASGEPWTVGIVDPDDRGRLWTQVETRPGRLAVATSGTQERGEHVWRMASSTTFTQVTVAAADIETADVLATAILAGGVDTLQLVQRGYDIDVLAQASDGRVWASPVFHAATA
ncbi:MAG TPA: FAD:protein FMN transferase, partial [Propionibacteriaceae bacterium]|nr:FAD:protein FMN transferase [Propionibacteriaceae bacterium]